MPVSYPALHPLFADQIALVESPAEADLYLFAHVMDIEHAPRDMVLDWRQRQRPVVIFSEEPFWDTIWGKRPLDHVIRVDTPFGALPVIQINHQTSDVFRFGRIPYYLLTNPRFARAYRRLFQRNAARTAAEWQRDWAARPVDLTFMFERRPQPHHNVGWPEADLLGLCAWRTQLAEACQTGRVERLGRSWQGGPSRFDLREWHADKLQQLDGRPRMMGAFENTHHPDYLTEKFFDAFACGAVPLYAASPGHRLHDFALPPASWLNLYGLTPEAAAERIANHSADPTAFANAQSQLAALFQSEEIWEAERQALKTRVLTALHTVLDTGQT